MPVLTLSLNVSDKKLAAVLAVLADSQHVKVESVGVTDTPDLMKGSKHLHFRGPLPGSGLPAPVENPEQYMNRSGTLTGTRGRPPKLTVEGMQKVWGLHTLGYTNSEISKGFNNLISVEAVRRLVSKIKETK